MAFGDVTVYATATKKYKGVTTGIVEIGFSNVISHKYVDMQELKAACGMKRWSTKKAQEWLNTEAGKSWAIKAKRISSFF